MHTLYAHIITYATGIGVGDVVVGLSVGTGTGAGVIGRGVGADVNGILPCNRRVKKRVSSSSTLFML